MAVAGKPKLTAREVIDRIMADERFRASSHFSDTVYADEPILTTGRQMATFLPDRYQEMRAISRWEPGADGCPGRWLSEAELFYRQGIFMADFEDDCAYHGEFRSYFPTYSAMSDHQLRGYFTWRAAVRRGQIEPTSLSFAFVYLYELINGIGVATPNEGFERFVSFWQAYRVHAPELDRHARVWLRDYVVYHGLDCQLLDTYIDTSYEEAITVLRGMETVLDGLKPPRGPASALPLPPNEPLEEHLFNALDVLSSYRMSGSRMMQDHRPALRHICCGVWARLRRHYARQNTSGAVESLFGCEVTLPYSMFGSAVFFEPSPHPDTDYEIGPAHRYSCRQGRWNVTRFPDQAHRNTRLGVAMRAADQFLREALEVPRPLKDTGKTPRYVQDIAKREVSAWIAWDRAHAPRVIDIDRTQLSSIRTAAAQTREALLIDEEREGEGELIAHALGQQGTISGQSEHHAPAQEQRGAPSEPPGLEATSSPSEQVPRDASERNVTVQPVSSKADDAPVVDPSDTPAVDLGTPPQRDAAPDASMAYLRALLIGDRDAMAQALAMYGGSEDMLIDALNEMFFDLLGDTAIECTADGPALIEDYRAEVEGALAHGNN